jgi:UDPglucose 6-dehydrogenase
MRVPTVIDLRNIYRPEEMLRRGFNYSSLGRGANVSAAV